MVTVCPLVTVTWLAVGCGVVVACWSARGTGATEAVTLPCPFVCTSTLTCRRNVALNVALLLTAQTLLPGHPAPTQPAKTNPRSATAIS
jgi:hypothetical protein